MTQNVDFSVRPDWLNDIRNIEVNQLLQIWKYTDTHNSMFLDLGCGTDKYLRGLLSISDSNYVGLDIIGNPDIKMDISQFPLRYLTKYFVISFGLFVYLHDNLKRKILNNVGNCIIQVNRNDTPISKKIDQFDASQGLQRFGIDKKFISTLDHKFEVYSNDICFFLVRR